MKSIKILFVGIIFLFAGCNRAQQFNAAVDMVQQAMKVVNMISVQDLKVLMESEEIYTLIDVRQKSEHYHGYIPGSVIIPRGSLEFSIGSPEFWEVNELYQPEKNEKIILYCKKGNRCILAAESLGKLGYKEVYALKEGWKGWEMTYPEDVEKKLEMLNGNGGDGHEDVGSGC